jgi:hypothetical protein
MEQHRNRAETQMEFCRNSKKARWNRTEIRQNTDGILQE